MRRDMFLVWLFVIGSAVLTSSLPPFQECFLGGWSCPHLEDSYSALASYEHIIFTCSDETGMEVTVDLEEENFHTYTTEVTVQNCTVVNLTLSQFNRRETLRSIIMLNIKTLVLMEASTKPHYFTNPPRIIFQNIEFLPVIPAKTFNALSHLTAELIEIENVKIGKIEQNSFEVLDASLTISNAVIDVVDTKAISILNMDDASVTIVNSKFRNVESKAFMFFSPQVKLFKNEFVEELREQSLVVNAESFLFYLNKVNIIRPNAFNITAQNISFVSNRFEQVSGGSFDEVHPNFADPETFFYQFRENEINFAEPLGFHHSWKHYEQIINSATLLIRDNHFNCTYALLGLKEFLPNKQNKSSQIDFYNSLLGEDTNECIHTYCGLPLWALKFAVNENMDTVINNSYISSEELNSFCSLVTEKSQGSSVFLKTNLVLLILSAILIMITRF